MVETCKLLVPVPAVPETAMVAPLPVGPPPEQHDLARLVSWRCLAKSCLVSSKDMTLPPQQSEAVATIALAFKLISDPEAEPEPDVVEEPGVNGPELLLN